MLFARRLPLAFLVVGALTAGSAGASSPAQKAQAAAHAYSIKIVIPGQSGGGTPVVTAPPDAVALGGTFSYPADGSVVATSSLSASASTDVGARTADARATSEVASLQLFGGEISATRLFVRATSEASPSTGSGNPGGAAIAGLTVLGQPVTATPNTRVPLADWGSAIVLEQGVDPTAPAGRKAARTTVAALDVQLTRDHGGLPAGSQILVAFAEASAQAKAAPPPPPPPPTGATSPGTTTPTDGGSRPAPNRGATPPAHPSEPHPSPFGTSPIQAVPHHGRPKLTAGPYVFPVFGPVSFTDSYGAPRADVGWHHGDDIFAPLGAPVLAVAKGVVFSVGWNDLGGNRLWLKDGQGNEYYYAHLSAYSPLAVNGGRVNAGDVLGFVGNTGDAISTPAHLHFEIHPVLLLGKGYDGVVDPTPYLTAWQHLRALTFSVGITPGKTAVSGTVRSTAPEPGAILLQVSDISSVAGLDPAAIKRALAAGEDIASNEGVAALLGLANRG